MKSHGIIHYGLIVASFIISIEAYRQAEFLWFGYFVINFVDRLAMSYSTKPNTNNRSVKGGDDL